jgi:putative ABC transport system permease protein
MNGIINLDIWQVMLAYVFVLIVLTIIRFRGIRREKEILLSSIRMTVQLILAGYLLVLVFDHPNPFITVGIIILMEGFAIYTVYKKFKGRLSGKLKKAIAISMVAGTLSCLLYFLLVVVQIDPWYDPQYFIQASRWVSSHSSTE